MNKENFFHKLGINNLKALRMLILSFTISLWPIQMTHADINTDLLEAASKGDILNVRELLDKGANINARDEDGYTALMKAATYGHTAIVKELLERGAVVHPKESNGGRLWQQQEDAQRRLSCF